MSRRRLALHVVATLAKASGWTALARRRRHRRGDYRLYILEYHDVTHDPSEKEGTVSAARFKRHLRYLKPRFQVETLATAVERLAAGDLARDLLVITFDDGYLGNYEAAWPALHSAGLPATIFLTTGFLDGEEIWVDFARRALAAVCRHTRALGADAVGSLRQALGSWPPTERIDAVVRQLKYLSPERRHQALGALRRGRSRPRSPGRAPSAGSRSAR